jgi:hypothetical protein
MAEYPNQRTLHYETKIVPATLKPDGYDQPGNFFTDDDGAPHMYGTVIQSRPAATMTTIMTMTSDFCTLIGRRSERGTL